MKTGAIPKLTKSVKESSSFPNSDVPLISLATLPSKASNIAANKIKITAKPQFPSIENFIELMPKQTPAKVRIFGNRYLVFFDETISKWKYEYCLYKSYEFFVICFKKVAER